MDAERKISSARAALIMSQPFFGSLALRLKVVENKTIDTMRVDGKTLEYNPTFVDELPGDQLKAVVAHEVMHCACLHHTRRGNRDLKLWNVAADYAINQILVDSGFKMPDDMLLDPQYVGMSAEKIYSALKPAPDPEGDDEGEGGGSGEGQPGDGEGGDDEGDGGPTDPGGCGEVVDAPPNADGQQPSPTDIAEQEREWQIAMSQAAQLEKAQGDMSSGLERMVEDALQPKADWRELLRQFMDQVSKSDYSWTPPNRRYAHQGLYLPSMRSEQLPPIVVAIDTSGSVSQSDLDQFAAELESILEEARPEYLHVVYCDTSVGSFQTFEPDDDIELKATGGGGTSFIPPFEWVTENDVDPVCMIYLTDLYSSRFPDEPDYPTLWGVYGSNTSEPPFGEVIDLN